MPVRCTNALGYIAGVRVVVGLVVRLPALAKYMLMILLKGVGLLCNVMLHHTEFWRFPQLGEPPIAVLYRSQ